MTGPTFGTNCTLSFAWMNPGTLPARTILAVTNKDMIQNKMISKNLRFISALPLDRKNRHCIVSGFDDYVMVTLTMFTNARVPPELNTKVGHS